MKYSILFLAIVGYVCCKEPNKDEKNLNTDNLKCTELKGKVEADILLHVPCVFLRVLEHFKVSCSLNELKDTFLDIRCSEKCTSGYLKKKINRAKERISPKKEEQNEIGRSKQLKNAKALLDILEVQPVELALNKKNSNLDNCTVFATALRVYLEETQDSNSIRNNIIYNSSDSYSTFDKSYLDKRMEKFRCKTEKNSQEIYFFYLKYLIGSIRSLLKLDTKNELSHNDLVEIFNPYIETKSKYDRMLTSKSYFAYLLANYDYYFNRNEDDCQVGSQKNSNKVFNNNYENAINTGNSYNTKNANDNYYTTLKAKTSKEISDTQTKKKMLDKFKIKKKTTTTIEPAKEPQGQTNF